MESSTGSQIEFGYTLSSEEHPPSILVENAQRAEEGGFDFVSVSDHFHPWVSEQGHSPFVWSVLGAIAVTTRRIRLGSGVTCPTMRIHPALVAHAAATVSLLSEGRFFLGVGTGEALNEHILTDRWPPADVRLRMLEEAVAVIRALWSGETVDHRGEFYDVENARLFDPPADEIPVVVSGFGERAAELAARIGDGYWGHSPDDGLVQRYAASGGSGPRYAQLDVCFAADEANARAMLLRVWPNAAISGQLAQDLPTWSHFEQAASLVREDDVAAAVPCGPDITAAVMDSVRRYLDAGYDHLYFHQIGPHQDVFFDYWRDELQPALAALEFTRSSTPGFG